MRGHGFVPVPESAHGRRPSPPFIRSPRAARSGPTSLSWFGAGLLAIWVMVGAAVLGACDYRVGELKPGKSTALQVRDVLGTPTAEWKDADGSVQWEFARGPQGVVTYMAIVGADNVLKEFRQVLAPPYFAKVEKSVSHEDVRRLIGRPGEQMTFPLRQEEVWSWRYEEGPNEQWQFHVHFDLEGKVIRTSRTRIGTPP